MIFHTLRCFLYGGLGTLRSGRNLSHAFSDTNCCLWVRFGAMDSMMHVNNSKYLEFFELARWEMAFRNGLIWRFVKNGCYPVVATAHLQYFTPLTCWKTVNVRTEFLGLHGKSIVLHQRIENEEGKKRVLYASSVIKMAFVTSAGKHVSVKEAAELFDLPKGAYEELEKIGNANSTESEAEQNSSSPLKTDLEDPVNGITSSKTKNTDAAKMLKYVHLLDKADDDGRRTVPLYARGPSKPKKCNAEQKSEL